MNYKVLIFSLFTTIFAAVDIKALQIEAPVQIKTGQYNSNINKNFFNKVLQSYLDATPEEKTMIEYILSVIKDHKGNSNVFKINQYGGYVEIQSPVMSYRFGNADVV